MPVEEVSRPRTAEPKARKVERTESVFIVCRVSMLESWESAWDEDG